MTTGLVDRCPDRRPTAARIPDDPGSTPASWRSSPVPRDARHPVGPASATAASGPEPHLDGACVTAFVRGVASSLVAWAAASRPVIRTLHRELLFRNGSVPEMLNLFV